MTITEEVRALLAAAWKEGYDEGRSGELDNNPYDDPHGDAK